MGIDVKDSGSSMGDEVKRARWTAGRPCHCHWRNHCQDTKAGEGKCPWIECRRLPRWLTEGNPPLMEPGHVGLVLLAIPVNC